VRYVDSSRYIDNLAQRVSVWRWAGPGDVKQAHDRAKEVGKGVDLAYAIPKEGAISNYRRARRSLPMHRTSRKRTCSSLTCCGRDRGQKPNLIKYANAVTGDIQPLDPSGARRSGVYPPPAVRGD